MTDRLRVLLSAPYMIPVQDRFNPLFDEFGIDLLIPTVRERLSETELLGYVSDVDGAICGDDAYTARVIAVAPKLKVISKWGTGIDSIDEEAAEARNIVVCRTSGAFTDPVADSVLGYMLAFARQILASDRSMKAGEWTKPLGVSLRESTLGIVGVGEIGQAVAKRAHAFGMTIMGCDIRSIPSAILAQWQVSMVEYEELIRLADFVSLNCDLNPTSYHLVGSEALRLMKSTAFLINTARGPVVDEVALAQALQRGDIAGVALDVFEHEPLPDDSLLRAYDNCLLAPHNANSSPTAWERVHRNTIENLLSVLRPGREIPWDRFAARAVPYE